MRRCGSRTRCSCSIEERGFSTHVKVFSTYSCHQKKERISQVSFLFRRRKIRTQSNGAAIYPSRSKGMDTPDISSTAHTGEPWKRPKTTQRLKMMKNCSTNKNISLLKITAYSCYQRPFVSTNSISFSDRKRKSQIKATSHIPAETHELS